MTVFPKLGQFCQKVNLDYLDSIKVNTQTGFLSNDAQEEFNFTYQSLLDYVGDTSIKDSFFNPRGTLKSLENKEFPDARVCGNGEIGQPKAPNSYLEETFANPEIRYPNITIDSGPRSLVPRRRVRFGMTDSTFFGLVIWRFAI